MQTMKNEVIVIIIFSSNENTQFLLNASIVIAFTFVGLDKKKKKKNG